ncbi:SMI1/KNR4 family protein [Nannocystis sp. SCPEA4]|uniref:SMI1/KNR4 family protein n=1 Tax=Nannocystis sp. SCPEA4 TaxID=2996787 RepID=UPI00226DF0C0|nr:SMI1/KNR4 family protein [Nannocystis sp. SCPEA4]MCY1059304.1 SMI1/KNR4 family protein [Nannocystis sp. SCPEA4]
MLDELKKKAATVDISLPPLLVALFERAAVDEAFMDALSLLGIEPEPIAVDDIDMAPEVRERLETTFVGFANDGFGDVFGLQRIGTTTAVVRLRHDDDSLHVESASFDEWLPAHILESTDTGSPPDEELLAAMTLVRGALKLS